MLENRPLSQSQIFSAVQSAPAPHSETVFLQSHLAGATLQPVFHQWPVSSARPQTETLDNLPLGQSQNHFPLVSEPFASPPEPFQFSFPQHTSVIKLERPGDARALTHYLGSYADYLETHPLVLSRLKQIEGGQSAYHMLTKARTGRLNADDIRTLQVFLLQGTGADLRTSKSYYGMDGKYGPKTHRALQQAFAKLQRGTQGLTLATPQDLFSPQPAVTQNPQSIATPAGQQAQLKEWQALATDIIKQGKKGVELPEHTAPLYAGLLTQVRNQTQAISPEQDPIKQRAHSIRPRIGGGYSLKQGKIYDQTGARAQVSAVIFDRSQNLLVALDHEGQAIMAVEARNNTRRSWGKTADWQMKHAMIEGSNAPAANGIYALGPAYRDSASSGKTFGSYKIVIKGGMITQRQILIHSRDHKSNKEIPWNRDSNDLYSRTLGCFLLQDPDLKLLAQLMKGTETPMAMVVQGEYAKNLKSPVI